MAQMNKTREELAKRFLELLNSDDKSSWKRGWKRLSVAKNGSSGYEYKGVNQFLLSLVALERGYNDGRWFTFKQASDVGYKVKKGEKSTPVEYWSYYDKVTKKNINYREYVDIIKNTPERKEDIQLVGKTFHVFNAAQLEGIEPEPELTRDEFSNNQIAKEFTGNLLDAFGIDLVHGGDRAFYSVTKDEIHMPHQTQFFSDYEYYATLLHELAHSTGAEKRLNRDLSGGFGSEKYAMEELRAEITSCFLSNSIGADMDTEEHIKNHKAYVSSWIQSISDKPEELFRAVKAAEKIAEYMEEQGNLENVLEKYPALNQEVVGRIYYFDNQGKVAEYVDYEDEERFKDAIREDLNTGITIKVEDRTEDKVYLNEVMNAFNEERGELEMDEIRRTPRRYSMNSEGEMQRTFNGKLPEEMSLEEQLRFIVDNDILLNGKVTDEVQEYLEVNGYKYEDGDIFKMNERAIDFDKLSKIETEEIEDIIDKLYSEISIAEKVQIVAESEQKNDVPKENKITYWYGDYAMYALKDGVSPEKLTEEWKQAINSKFMGISRNATEGSVYILTEYGYKKTPEDVKAERTIGKPIPGYETHIPASWEEKGYVIEVKEDMLKEILQSIADKQLSDNKTQTFNNVVKMGRSL